MMHSNVLMHPFVKISKYLLLLFILLFLNHIKFAVLQIARLSFLFWLVPKDFPLHKPLIRFYMTITIVFQQYLNSYNISFIYVLFSINL